MKLTRRDILLSGAAAATGAGTAVIASRTDFATSRPGESLLRREFLDGQIVMVDGLVLSRSEYAWLARNGDDSTGTRLVETLRSMNS